MPAGSPLAGCAGEIIHRFDEKLDGARLDGCDEIQIVSHSLGTVIAYHALARRAWDAEPMRRITRIYTLGSPLEKIGFFWPRLIPRDGAGHPLLQWHNICDRLDGVAGKLKRFNHWTPVQNHRVWGLGGAARAHIMYQRSPVFQDLVTEGLFGAPSHGKISRWWELFKASVETLIMPVALVIGAVVGLGFVVLVAALFPYLAGWLLRLIGLGQWEPAVRSWGTWGIAGVIVLSSLVATLSEASDLHRRVLAGGQTANEEMPR
jgi:hypothetical protein